MSKESVCVLRCFFLTENARVEQATAVDRFVSSSAKRSHESLMGIGISGSFYAVLMQCSPQIFQVINCTLWLVVIYYSPTIAFSGYLCRHSELMQFNVKGISGLFSCRLQKTFMIIIVNDITTA